MTDKSYTRQCIERDLDALNNPQHSDIRDLLAELDALAAERDGWKREAETAINELNRIAAMLPDSDLDIASRVHTELATMDAMRDEHADAVLELRGLRRMIHGDAKPLEMLEMLRDGPLTSWRIDGLHWFAKLDWVGTDGRTFVGSGDTRDEAVDNARTYAERYLARASGSLDFPDLRSVKPGRYITEGGVRFEVPCKHQTSTEECCNNPEVGSHDEFGDAVPECCGKPIRRCDRCGDEVSDPAIVIGAGDWRCDRCGALNTGYAKTCGTCEIDSEISPMTIIGAADYPALGITDATPAKDLVEALLDQKPARVGPSQYECADCHEPLTGLGAKVHECAKPCPGCTDPAGLAYHDPKLCGLEWQQDRWCRRCQRDTNEPEIGDATGICQECLSETNHCLRCGQHRSRCEHGQSKPLAADSTAPSWPQFSLNVHGVDKLLGKIRDGTTSHQDAPQSTPTQKDSETRVGGSDASTGAAGRVHGGFQCAADAPPPKPPQSVGLATKRPRVEVCEVCADAFCGANGAKGRCALCGGPTTWMPSVEVRR